MMDPKETDPKPVTGPGHVHLDHDQAASLEKPKSKEELQELAAQLNKD